MSPVIGIALFAIGVGALLLSIVLDRRPHPGKPASDAAAGAGSEPPGEERTAPAPEAPAMPMVAEPDLPLEAPEPATSAEARLENLRAELAGRRPQTVPAAPQPTAPLEPEPGVPGPSGEPEDFTGSEPAARMEHGHAIPIVSHSDLASHLRREHPDLGSGGSTIQMRRLHDGAHAS